jgi:precorrin-3B C17-methyltransferase
VTGKLFVIGLGPGPERWLTAEAASLLAEATDILGYAPYVDRVAPSNARRHPSDNRVELDRAREALAMAEAGASVALVSGGDPGVFAMAAAARIGAPLGHDFCAISLSDNQKPWALIEKRLRAAAEASFVMALYNPASKARPDQISKAFAVLSDLLSPDTIVVFARAVGRKDEDIEVTTLAKASDAACDMRTLVIIGSQATRKVECVDGRTWVYTPRSARGE